MIRTALALTLAAALGGSITGCASLTDVRADVSSYSAWPADRKPSTYAFERLPSQRANPDQQRAEEAAAPALAQAGFTPAADEKSADVSVQVGVRVTALVDPYGPPFGGRGGIWIGGRGGGLGWGWPMMRDTTYDREAVVVIRDRRTGQPVYEAHASSAGLSPSVDGQLAALFRAALVDFPAGGPSPRKVVVPNP